MAYASLSIAAAMALGNGVGGVWRRNIGGRKRRGGGGGSGMVAAEGAINGGVSSWQRRRRKAKRRQLWQMAIGEAAAKSGVAAHGGAESICGDAATNSSWLSVIMQRQLNHENGGAGANESGSE